VFAILVGYHVNGLKNSTTGAFNLNSVNVVEHDCHLPEFFILCLPEGTYKPPKVKAKSNPRTPAQNWRSPAFSPLKTQPAGIRRLSVAGNINATNKTLFYCLLSDNLVFADFRLRLAGKKFKITQNRNCMEKQRCAIS